LAKGPDKQQIAFLEQFKLQDFQIKKLEAEKDKLTKAVAQLKRQVAKLQAENEALKKQPSAASPAEQPAKSEAPAANNGAATPPGVNGEAVVIAITTWMNDRPVAENSRVIWFTNVDKELNLPAGAARAYMPQAAEKIGYQVLRKTEGTILLKKS